MSFSPNIVERRTSSVDYDLGSRFHKRNDMEQQDSKDADEQVVEEGAPDSKENQVSEKKFSRPSFRLLVIGGCVVAVLFGVILFAVVIELAVGLRDFKYADHREKFCDKIAKYSRTKKLEGTGFNKTPEVYDINRCTKKTGCDFDVISCESPCPLGFETEDDCVVSCECATHGTFQLDIQFDESSVNALMEQTYEDPEDDFVVFTPKSGILPWIQNVVNGRPQIPYEFDEILSFSQKETLMEAFAIFRDQTCIDFVPRYVENDYIYFQDGDSDCSASYSRQPGKNTVNIAACYSYSHVLHVLMHSLGFHHEHMRLDRDDYIDIQWENIDPAYENAFEMLNSKNYLKLGTEFDIQSIMMLDGFAFSKTDDKTDPTMIDISNNKPAKGGGSMFTESDLRKIKLAYCGGILKTFSVENAIQGRSMATGRSISYVDESFYMEWSEWTSWAGCRGECIYFSFKEYRRFRHRDCKRVDENCVNIESESMPCPEGMCPVYKSKKWTNWTACSKTCDRGVKHKYLICEEGDSCPEPRRRKTESCCRGSCTDKHSGRSGWTQWGRCSTTCGTGTRNRARKLINFIGNKICAQQNITETVQFQYSQCKLADCIEEKPVEPEDLMVMPPEMKELEFHQTFDLKSTEIKENFCDQFAGYYWFLGDFNGDGRTDVMCGADINLLTVFLLNAEETYQKQWSGRFDCAIDFMYIGDFDGNGADDVFCKSALLSKNFVYRSMADGFTVKPIDVGPFCLNLFDTIKVIDVNGDGRSDIICRHDQNKDDTDVYTNAMGSFGY